MSALAIHTIPSSLLAAGYAGRPPQPALTLFSKRFYSLSTHSVGASELVKVMRTLRPVLNYDGA